MWLIQGAKEDLTRALDVALRASVTDPWDAGCHFNVGLVRLWAEGVDAARPAFQRAIENKPGDSYVLAYEFINFATNGLFIGSRQSYLSVHTDDLFIEDELWNPATNMPYPDQSYRMTPADVATTVTNQNAFRADHPLASGYVTQFPFNGYGAGDGYTCRHPNAHAPPHAEGWKHRRVHYLQGA
mgnify:CR=1 FL=1